MLHVYQYLASQQKVRHYETTPDGVFFFKHQFLLLNSPLYAPLANIRRPFDYLRANIIITALQNQALLDEEARQIASISPPLSDRDKKLRLFQALAHRPYFEDNGIRIYVPLYSRSMNLVRQSVFTPGGSIYQTLDPSANTDLIDPFEQYNFALYSSNFTSLIEVGGSGSAKAYYHMDFMTLYLINDQGRIDVALPLFDRRMKKFSTNHMLERLAPVVRAFFNGDRTALVSALYNGKLISSYAYARLLGLKAPLRGRDDEV